MFVGDSVKKIRVINPNRVYITLGRGLLDSCVTVILEGKYAVKKAASLRPYMLLAKGHIEIIDNKPFLTVTDFRRIKRFDCNCLVGDPNIDFLIPLPLTIGQQDTLKTILSNRVKSNAPGLPLKDVKDYIGHEIYIRDSIIGFHQFSKSFTALYLGAKYPNQIVTILITDESLNGPKAPWRSKGIGHFYGEVTFFRDKASVIISSKEQMIIEGQQ